VVHCRWLRTLVKVSSNDGKLSLQPANESREANAMSGTIRQLVNNMVHWRQQGL
jgi:ribosomal protein L6P/L9E